MASYEPNAVPAAKVCQGAAYSNPCLPRGSNKIPRYATFQALFGEVDLRPPPCAADEEVARVRAAQAHRGMLHGVAAVPLSLVKGTVNLALGRSASGPGKGGGEDSLATQWVDFLVQQAALAEASEQPNGTGL